MKLVTKTRNIGISAHIDSGKTTLTERILYYCDKIYKIGEVRGGGSGAKMDHMELEREKGITITSAATTVTWAGLGQKGIPYAEGANRDVKINIIDTPGHVDFTVEVERSLRVLDGAILVLCSVAGVQSQSITVDRQMKRYSIPRIAFMNKMDRMGADPYKGAHALRTTLNHNAVLMQIPVGREENFCGVVDLVKMKAIYFDGDNGENVRVEEIPQEYLEEAEGQREEMLDKVSEFSDALTEKLLEEEEVTEEEIHNAVKVGVQSLRLTPVFMGSALKNNGVQPVLDAVARYLPSPVSSERPKATDSSDHSTVELNPVPDAPLVCMAFKITDEKFGMLTYTRIYQGTLKKGEVIYNTRTGQRVRVGRIVRMHADDKENIESVGPGDIAAMVGVDCASGDTFVGLEEMTNLFCEGIHVAIPVIEFSIAAKGDDQQTKLSKGLSRFVKEDPTFHVYTDEESAETRIAGMGELHLGIYVERLKREYRVDVIVGPPQVNYRETIKSEYAFNYTHKKQTGGSGQFAQVVGLIRPLANEDKEKDDQVFKFHNVIKGGSIPSEYFGACKSGFEDGLGKGPSAAFPVIDIEVFLKDGKHHDVDSSDMAFRIACRSAMKLALSNARPILLEPVMNVEIETPEEFQGGIIGDLSVRRGMIQGTKVAEGSVIVNAYVPLAQMFGYATTLRSLSSGKASFTMEFHQYMECPSSIAENIIKERAKKKEQRS